MLCSFLLCVICVGMALAFLLQCEAEICGALSTHDGDDTLLWLFDGQTMANKRVQGRRTSLYRTGLVYCLEVTLGPRGVSVCRTKVT